MENIIRKSLWIIVLVFFVSLSIITETISVYTNTFNPAGGNVDLVYPGGEVVFPDVFHKVADTNDKFDPNEPDKMTGDMDAFVPVDESFNIVDGYTYSVSVTTSEQYDFEGMGFYFYSFANPKNSTVDGLSLQLTPGNLVGRSQFVYLKKSYNSLSVDSDLSDGNDSIIFVDDDFWRYDNIIRYPATLENVTSILESSGKYNGTTLDFKVAVKQDSQNPNQLGIQVTVNNYGFGFFTTKADIVTPTDNISKLCVGLKTFHTNDKYFKFSNVKIGPHEVFKQWQYQ